MASDEPAYRVEPTPDALRDVAAEIRFYDSVLVAAVRVQSSSWRQASGAAFRPLANYIFGQNSQGEKIGMTTPVTTHQVTEDSNASSDVWEVRFFMPPRYSSASLPEPQNPYIRIETQQAVRYAAIRFSGQARDEAGVRNFATHERKLRLALAKAGLNDDGVAHYAVYNGPWTPSLLRRNEVLIALP